MGLFLFGLFLIIIILIICFSVLFSNYMNHCSKKNINMFEDPRYNERINKLEMIIINLDKRIKELEEK